VAVLWDSHSFGHVNPDSHSYVLRIGIQKDKKNIRAERSLLGPDTFFRVGKTKNLNLQFVDKEKLISTVFCTGKGCF